MHTLALLIALGTATAQEAPAKSPPPSAKSNAKSNDGRGFGVGIQTTLPGGGSRTSGPEAGISVVFDRDQWRIASMLNVLFAEDNFTTFRFGGRFFYRLHKTRVADFSAGAGAGFEYFDTPGDGNENIGGYFEAIGQIRVFLVSNVSLNANVGFGFRVGDGPNTFGLTGQANGGFGATYFF